MRRWCLGVGVAFASAAAFLLFGGVGCGSGASQSTSRWTLAFLVPNQNPSGAGEHLIVVRSDGSGRHRSTFPGVPLLSPDGRKLAYAPATGVDLSRLYVADRSGRGRQPLTRAKNYYCDAVWSPDSKKLLYTTDCDVDRQAIGVVNADGSGERVLTGKWSQNPAWSPDGRTILFTSVDRPGAGPFRLYLMDEHGRKRKRIPGRYPEPNPSPNSGLTWSRDGQRIFFLTYHTEELWVINRDGSGARNLMPRLAKVRDFDLSPDGRKLVLTAPGTPDRGWEIYTADTDGNGLRQLTDNRTNDVVPTWSPDGQKIAFMSSRDGTYLDVYCGYYEIYVMNADGTAPVNVGRSLDEAPVWLPPGSRL
jgi:Tol biopolymer transport system component